VFDNQTALWELPTSKNDVKLEDQFFDRKEAGSADSNGNVSGSQISSLIDHLTATISAFANENHDGGLFGARISKTGEVKGLSHLSDVQRNFITQPGNWLIHQNARVKLHNCSDPNGKIAKVGFIYVPYTANAICKTLGYHEAA
jgi:hypothetical protein